MNWIFGNPPALVNAAVTGVFTPTARWDYWSKPREMQQANERESPVLHPATHAGNQPGAVG